MRMPRTGRTDACVAAVVDGMAGWRASVLAAASGNTTRRMTLPTKTETEMLSVGIPRYEAMLARIVSHSIAVIDSDVVRNVIQIVVGVPVGLGVVG